MGEGVLPVDWSHNEQHVRCKQGNEQVFHLDGFWMENV